MGSWGLSTAISSHSKSSIPFGRTCRALSEFLFVFLGGGIRSFLFLKEEELLFRFRRRTDKANKFGASRCEMLFLRF